MNASTDARDLIDLPANAVRRHPGSLSPSELAQYEHDGFLIVRDYFDAAELRPVMAEYAALVDQIAKRLQSAGKIGDTFAEEPFSRRLTLLEQSYPGSAVLVMLDGILGKALADLWATPRLLGAMSQLLGDQVAGHPVWNIRSKTPNNPLTTVPWHQDAAYLDPASENTHQPTAWIPFCNATSKMGCLQVLRGGHRAGIHCHRLENTKGDARSWYLMIDEADMPHGDIVTCEIPFGSFLLLNQTIPHRSTENFSDKIRWSVDLRWQRPDQPSGFDAIKPPILMRTSDPAFRPDWDVWANHNRVTAAMSDTTTRDEFDTRISGPWMDRWK
jgi:ectoine hydroxylase-related dioxygenase (phytanoyl-CoA dioxygenase family)